MRVCELPIVGAVYDFANDMRKGAGKLDIINGESAPAKLRNMQALAVWTGSGRFR